MVNIVINDREIAVPKGELIVESVKRLGLEIPIFCYHPRMKPVGMCRMCLVEVGFKQADGTVRKMPKPQAGCTLPASEGMVIFTDTEMVHRDRKGVLEFLLINHPLDCPICDRGGECPLQNNTLFYGPSTSRFVELKRHLPKAFPLSKYVTLDLERCIQCGRCVRFTEEISGDSQLAFRFRGSQMQPSTFEMTDFNSKFSGNVIEICPVGALTSSEYRFRARPWDIETKPAVCTVCSNGCNIWFDHRAGNLVRINGRTNEAVNEEWTCDKGKFGHEFYNSSKRLTHPMIRKGNGLVECTWAEAYQAIADAFAVGGNRVAVLGGQAMSTEGQYLVQKLFRGSFNSNNLDHRAYKTLSSIENRVKAKSTTPIASYENSRVILSFGTSLADDLPILFLRIRKAWFLNAAKVIVAHHSPTDADSFAQVILRYRAGTQNVLAAGLAKACGASTGPSLSEVETETGVKMGDLLMAVETLKDSQAPIASATSIYNEPHAQETIDGLAVLAQVTGGTANLYALAVNEEGAESVGLRPDSLPGGIPLTDTIGRTAIEKAFGFMVPAEPGLGTHQALNAASNGWLKSLWLIDFDPIMDHPDRELAARALENVDFLVYQGSMDSAACAYASVILPASAPAEQDGSYTSMERRVQRMKAVLKPKGESKPDWRIFSELALRIKPSTPFFNPSEVMDEIGKVIPEYANATYANLDGDGIILG